MKARDLVDALFPAICANCGESAGDGDFAFICATCQQEIPQSIWPIATFIPCIRGGWYLFQYEGIGGQLVRTGKYGKRELLLAELAGMFAEATEKVDLPQFDLIVPAPAPKSRLVDRGFSAPAMFADKISHKLGIPSKEVLKRKWTPYQAGLTDEKRAENVSGAYEVIPKRKILIEGAKILLVDDVVTTGSTASECAETLLLGGSEGVWLLAFASVLR